MEEDLDNSGNGTLRVPGINQIPVEFELPGQSRFMHNEWRHAPAVTSREVTMVFVMNRITDYQNWHVDVFDDGVVNQWREEAFANMSLMSEKSWEWCVKELRDKAIAFETTKHVRVLDTGSCIVKTDAPTLQSTTAAVFRQHLTEDFVEHRRRLRDKLLARDKEQTDSEYLLVEKAIRDYCIGWEEIDKILRIVDPLEYPLAYGTTQVLAHGGKVDMHDLFSTPFKEADLTEKQEDLRDEEEARYGLTLEARQYSHPEMCIPLDRPHDMDIIRFDVPFHWSWNYQSLPCEVEFCSREKGSSEVRITSYINNLHPEHKELYGAIEQVLAQAIPAWNASLIQGQKKEIWEDRGNHGQFGPVPMRIVTYGVEPIDETGEGFKIPEPGTAVSYEDWKAGRDVGRAIVQRNKKDRSSFVLTDTDHRPYTIALQDTFREKGLQVFVDMASVELTPNSCPDFDGNLWQQPGRMNEHIVGVAVFAFDVDNVTLPSMAFRQLCEFHSRDYVLKEDEEVPGYVFAPYESEEYEETEEYKRWIASDWLDNGEVDTMRQTFMYPPELEETAGVHEHDYDNISVLRTLGSVTMPQGRLISFANVLDTRIEPMELVDDTKPGHFRWLKLYLVDPHYRICSTRNVPPQQHAWWAKEVRPCLWPKLPMELVDQILQETDRWPMDTEKAEDHRKASMREQVWKEMYKMSSFSLYLEKWISNDDYPSRYIHHI